ncbi:hypothetical protein TRFO_27991 [Tritrichomonas foetus]|uniref:Zinc finger Sec23/Sec24-type domain-containing protein n=1 Tax=Tritrichomonas foetus TaxID=1144522 RepID=A0A1J4K0Q7_9EUKA|nr:hypothetical protein TRFO_27991 [Tritrichomonas foetus]|eukprot:OHT04538.1 hypothetical protein TRFO_27991 [Tritrichomonas foetus]
MQSTLSVFPATKKLLESTKIPFVMYTQPIPEDLHIFENSNIQVPRCPNPNCTAFFNGLCSINSRGWSCSVCGQHSNFKDKELASLNSLMATPSFQIIDPSVTFPLTHVIIVGCGDLSPASAIMQSLPPEAPVWVFVMNTDQTARKLVTTAGNLSQLSKLPKSAIRVPLTTTIPLLLTLLNAKKSCFWCRVFCAGCNIDDKTIEKLKQIDKIPIRIDFFIDSPISPSISTFSSFVPGVIRTYQSFSNQDSLNQAIDVASYDCARPFGFQCKVIVKSGPHYKSSCDADRPTLSVIASSRAVVPFIVVPPVRDQKLMFQAIQVLAHVHIWDPPTNTLKKCTNVLNFDFPVSSDINTLISSASSSSLFDYWSRHNQLHLADRLKPDFENIKPLASMCQKVNSKNKKEFESFCTEFFALCPPTTWRFVLGTYVETLNNKDSNETAVIIVKKFPNVYFALKEGVDVLLGDTVRKFVELCRPLSVSVHQYSFDQIHTEFKKELISKTNPK